MLPVNVNDSRARIRSAVTEVTPKSNVTPGKKFIIGGIFVLLPPEVIPNCKTDASENNFACYIYFSLTTYLKVYISFRNYKAKFKTLCVMKIERWDHNILF
jgi:hypothetical protein